MTWFIYQPHTQPVLTPAQEPEEVSEDRWHQPWSEPVRVRINPALAIALINSGLTIAPQIFGEVISVDKWFAHLSLPTPPKPGLAAASQRPFTEDTKLLASLSAFLEGWYNWLNEPVRLKIGLSPTLQQFLAYHPRLLPTPNITAILHAIEINSDTSMFAINVIQSNPAASAKVSIVEIGSGNSATSVGEH